MGKWDRTVPRDSDTFADVPGICKENFYALDDLFETEHNTFASAGSGTHKAGTMGIVKSGATAVIAALSSPGSGAMAWDSSLGYWKRYWASAWGVPGTGTKWSRVRAYKDVNHQNLTSVGGDSQIAQITFETEDYDGLGEFAANAFTVAGGCSGYYLIAAAWAASGKTVQDSFASRYTSSGVTEAWYRMSVRAPTGSADDEEWTASGSNNNYENVDELGNPTTTDFNYSTSPTIRDTFTFTAFSIPAGATIKSVQVLVHGFRSTAVGGIQGSISVGGTWYDAATQNLSLNDNRFLIFSWLTNPATSVAWTLDEVNGADPTNPLEYFGYESFSGFRLTLYQTQIRVIYTLADTNYQDIDESTVSYTDGLIDATVGLTANAEVLSASVPTVPVEAANLSATLTVVARKISPTNAGKIHGVLRVGTTNYYSSAGSAEFVTPLSGVMTEDYITHTFTWSANPVTSGDWSRAQFIGTAANAISGFGFFTEGGTACSAEVVQSYLTYYWDQPNPTMSILLLKSDTVVASATKEVRQPGTETDEQIKLVEMIYLTAGDTIKVQAKKTLTDDVILSGSDATYIAIHRLGSQGL